MEKRLRRSRDDRMVWGVCGGIARYFNIDPVFVRVIAIIILVLSAGMAIIAYILAAIVMPAESSSSEEPREVIRENVEEMKQTATQMGEEIRSTFAPREGEIRETSQAAYRSGYVLAIVLIILGVLFMLGNFNLFWWFRWEYLWPLVLIGIGLVIILNVRRR